MTTRAEENLMDWLAATHSFVLEGIMRQPWSNDWNEQLDLFNAN